MIWARDLGPTKVSKSSEYFVYWGLFEMNCWGKRSDQIAKGEFLEVPWDLSLSCNGCTAPLPSPGGEGGPPPGGSDVVLQQYEFAEVVIKTQRFPAHHISQLR